MSIRYRTLAPASGDTDNQILGKILQQLGGGTLDGVGVVGFAAVDVLGASEFTRPGDTAAYQIGDVVGTNPGTLLSFSVPRTPGFICSVRVTKSTVTTASSSVRLYLFSAAPAAIADNSPFTLLYADRASLIGFVDLLFVTEGVGSDSAVAETESLRLPFDLAGGNIYGVLVAEAAYAPGNAEKFYAVLTVE